MFDVQFKEGMHLARAGFFFAAPTNPRQFVAKFLALGIGPIIRPILRVNARKHSRRQHRGGKARAFLVGPVCHDNRVFGFDPKVIERAQDFQPTKYPQDAVVFATRWLRIKV